MTETTCQKCGYEWTYSGESNRATCPNCYKKTHVGSDDARIPLDWVVGVDEVTVWFWPDTPDPLTVRFPLRKWAKIERKTERSEYNDLEDMVGTVVLKDLPENPSRYFSEGGASDDRR